MNTRAAGSAAVLRTQAQTLKANLNGNVMILKNVLMGSGEAAYGQKEHPPDYQTFGPRARPVRDFRPGAGPAPEAPSRARTSAGRRCLHFPRGRLL